MLEESLRHEEEMISSYPETEVPAEPNANANAALHDLPERLKPCRRTALGTPLQLVESKHDLFGYLITY